MSLHPEEIEPVPEETTRIARAAFPRGNVRLRLRDVLGTIYTDQLFALAVLPRRRMRMPPCNPPHIVALLCVR
jgi:transposase